MRVMKLFSFNTGRSVCSKIRSKINRIATHGYSNRKYGKMNINQDLLNEIKRIKGSI